MRMRDLWTEGTDYVNGSPNTRKSQARGRTVLRLDQCNHIQTKWSLGDEDCFVQDIRFEKNSGRRFQMFMVPYGIGSVAYISNYTYWKKYKKKERSWTG
jgi:hypothetical protein